MADKVFHTVYIFGRNYDKMKRSSCNFRTYDKAEGWAEFLNSEEEDNKPANRRVKHFVVQIFELEEQE
jgi:hypothetical protein